MYCPLKFTIIGRGDMPLGTCYGLSDCTCEGADEECRWWDPDHGKCVIVLIPQMLDGIENSIYQITGK